MSISKKSQNLPCYNYQQYKPMPEVREGDWVCVRCSNFNFSFRNACNRCKIQTRDTNFFEFVYQPLPMIYITQNDTEPESTEDKETEKIFDSQSNKENNPFQSAILLTPIKNQRPETDGEPYKSPYYVPSVSPLLKKYNNSLRNQNFSNTTKVTSSPYQQTKFEGDIFVSQFNIDNVKYPQQEEDEEMEMHISQLLASIDL